MRNALFNTYNLFSLILHIQAVNKEGVYTRTRGLARYNLIQRI